MRGLIEKLPPLLGLMSPRAQRVMFFIALMFPPVLTVGLLSTGTNVAPLARYLEIPPQKETVISLDGLPKSIVLEGGLFPRTEPRGAAPCTLVVTVFMPSGSETRYVPANPPGKRRIAFSLERNPRRMVISCLVPPEARSGTVLFVTDLRAVWEQPFETSFTALWGILRVWAIPRGSSPAVVLYLTSLLLAVGTCLFLGSNRKWLLRIRGLSGTPHGFMARLAATHKARHARLHQVAAAPPKAHERDDSKRSAPFFSAFLWLLPSAAVLCVLPTSFSPFTRLAICSVPICTFALLTVLLGVIGFSVGTRTRLHWAAILLLLSVVGVRFMVALDAGDRMPTDVDEKIYLGIAANLLQGKGMILPDSAYKPKDAPTSDPVVRSWLRNEMFLGIAHRGERTALVPPGYSLLLMVIQRLFGSSPVAVYLIQAILASISCLLLFLLARAAVGLPAALVAVAIIGFHSPGVATVRYVFTESLFILLILTSFLLVQRRTLLWMALSGFVLGLAALTRSVGFMLVPLFVAYAAMTARNHRHRWLGPIMLVVFCLIVAMPWALRNKAVVGEMTVGCTSTGTDLFVGNNVRFKRESRDAPAVAWGDFSIMRRRILKLVNARPQDVRDMFDFPMEIPREGPRNRELLLRTAIFGICYPRAFIELTWSKLLNLLGIQGQPEVWEFQGQLPFLFLPVLLPLGILGLLTDRKGYPEKLLLGASAVALIAPAVLAAGYPRYRIMSDWLLAPLAGGGLVWLFSILGRIRISMGEKK